MPAEPWREHGAAAVPQTGSGGHGLASTSILAGCQIPFAVDEVLVGPAGAPGLFTGKDLQGQRWLVAQVGDGIQARRWLCTPASDLAIRCVLSGRAHPADLFRHSATGTVEDITIGSEGRVFESVRLCAELGDDEVPSEMLVSQTCRG